MANKKEIEAQINKLRNDLYKVEQDEFNKIQVPFLKSLVGKCFSYRNNSYGGDGGRWNVYKKVVELYTKKNGSVYLITEDFSVDCYGKPELSVECHHPYTNEAWRLQIPFSGYVEITKKEYENEKQKMLKEMSSFKKMKKYLDKE